MKKKYVLKNKKRFSTFVISILIFISVMAFANSAYGYQKARFKEISVKPGDTLWSIASKYSDNSDIRKYIFDIKRINNMKSSNIYTGAVLLIPE